MSRDLDHHLLVYAAPATLGFRGPLCFAVGEVLPHQPGVTLALFGNKGDAHLYAGQYAAAHESATGEALSILIMPSAELENQAHARTRDALARAGVLDERECCGTLEGEPHKGLCPTGPR